MKSDDEKIDTDRAELRNDNQSQIIVKDTGEYTQSRRLTQIHDIKEYVNHIYIEGGFLVEDRYEKQYREPDYRRMLAISLSLYASELKPIIERTDSEFLKEKLPNSSMTVQEFINSGGNKGKKSYQNQDSYPVLSDLMWLKQELDGYLAKVGLGVEIEENKGPAEI